MKLVQAQQVQGNKQNASLEEAVHMHAPIDRGRVPLDSCATTLCTSQVQEERRKAKDGEVQRREEARRVATATQAAFEARQAADRGGRAAFEEPPGGSMVELPAELQVSKEVVAAV